MNKEINSFPHVITKKQKIYLVFKRIIDSLIALISLIILSPMFLIIALAIKFDSEGPVFFRQTRVGKNKVPFEMYKFRTMSIKAPKNKPTRLLKDPYVYITRVGRFLRKTSLDEFPQLLNVLFGDMFLVSMRPVIPDETDLISERDKYGVYQIAPGITGLAQINGRDKLDIYEKARLDGKYLKCFGPKLDIYCLVKTIISVFFQEDIVEGEAGLEIEKSKTDRKY